MYVYMGITILSSLVIHAYVAAYYHIFVCMYVCSYGDMRIAMNSLMINKWNILGNYQSRYVPGMIGPFLKVSLIPHTGKQKCIES